MSPFWLFRASSLSLDLDREGVFYQVSNQAEQNTSGLWEKINGGFQLTEDIGDRLISGIRWGSGGRLEEH